MLSSEANILSVSFFILPPTQNSKHFECKINEKISEVRKMGNLVMGEILGH